MALLFSVYIPVIAAAAVWNVYALETGLVASCAGFVTGILIWTLLEYLIHRFAFHGIAPHSRHHADPIDPKYILSPLWLSLSVALIGWVLLALAFGSWGLASLIVSGVISGYLGYEWVHLRIHSGKRGGVLLRIWRRHHYYHHFANDRTCFGVTSLLWDRVFGSLPRP